MIHKNAKGKVPVTYRKSGETQMLQAAATPESPPAAETTAEESQIGRQTKSVPQIDNASGVGVSEAQAADALTEVEEHVPASLGDVESARAKAEFETLEQFISHAYARKGKRLVFTQTVAKAISRNLRLDEEGQLRLMAVAATDFFLVVPRQLLFLSWEAEEYPALRAALIGFVSGVMLKHPVYSDPVIQATIRNLPDEPTAEVALARVMAFVPSEKQNLGLSSAKLQTLRRNASSLLGAWLASSRDLCPQDLAALMFQVVWQPAANDISGDSARLRLLTDVVDDAAIGFLGQCFKQDARDARMAQENALRELRSVKVQLADVESKHRAAELQSDAWLAELVALRQRSEDELRELRENHQQEQSQLLNELDQVRGRAVRKLLECTEMLEVGVAALRNSTPRVEVMLERAEHVLEVLQNESNQLKGPEL